MPRNHVWRTYHHLHRYLQRSLRYLHHQRPSCRMVAMAPKIWLLKWQPEVLPKHRAEGHQDQEIWVRWVHPTWVACYVPWCRPWLTPKCLWCKHVDPWYLNHMLCMLPLPGPPATGKPIFLAAATVPYRWADLGGGWALEVSDHQGKFSQVEED